MCAYAKVLRASLLVHEVGASWTVVTFTQILSKEKLRPIQPDQRTAKSRSASPAVFLSLLPERIYQCFLAVTVASELLSQDKTHLFSSYACFIFVRMCVCVDMHVRSIVD